MACRVEAAWPTALYVLATRGFGQLTGFGRETRTVSPSGGVSWAEVHAITLSTWGMPAYPLAAPPSRVVRKEETDEQLLAVKGAIHDFVSSSCTSGKKGTGAERSCETPPSLRNQLSSIQLDTHGCPGKHGRQLWVGCGGGDNTRGGHSHRTFILRGCKPIPR